MKNLKKPGLPGLKKEPTLQKRSSQISESIPPVNGTQTFAPRDHTEKNRQGFEMIS